MPNHMPQRMTISTLPADLLAFVVGHVDQDSVAALRSVCRSLRHAVDLTTTQATFHPNVDAAELGSTTRRCTGLHTVKLQQLHPEAASATLEALAAMQHLRSLDMPMCEDMQLDEWTQLMSGLTHLALRQFRRSHRGTLAAVLPQLTALQSFVLDDYFESYRGLLAADVQRFTTLSRLTHLDLGEAEGAAALAPQLPRLQSLALHLRYPDHQTQVGWQQELSALNPLTRLTQLRLAAHICDPRLDVLQLGANVQVSLLGTPTERWDAYIPPRNRRPPLPGIPHLATLRAENWWPPAQCRHNQDGVLEAAPPFDTLREFRMDIACLVEPEDVTQLAAIARRLRVLHLQSCHGLLTPVLRAAVVVEDVSLTHARSGELLAALRPAAGTLRALEISSAMVLPNYQLRGSDVDHLAALTGLTSLSYGVHDEGWDVIRAVAELTLLRRLQLDQRLSSFDDARLAQLSALSRLTSLELSGAFNQRSSGAWLAAVAAALVPLRELRLCMGAVLPGCGAEAAIGHLTRLTSLHLSSDWPWESRRTMKPLPTAPPLQLQLLGCSEECGAADAAATGRNTVLQELTLQCGGRLSDEDLAAAAAVLPDLRRLEVAPSCKFGQKPLHGLSGAGLAAFSACPRLRCISLQGCPDLRVHQLVRQLPDIPALASLHLKNCPKVDSSSSSMEAARAAFRATEHLQAAFRAKTHRDLQFVRSWGA